MSEATAFTILLISCCIVPVVIFLLIVKLIIRVTPNPNQKLIKNSTYFDFFTLRGLFLLIASVILILIGFNNRYLTDLLILGIFVFVLIFMNLFICLAFKLLLHIHKDQIEFTLSNDTYYADQSLKISRINIPIISKLIYIFPTRIDIFTPERLGGNLSFELNSKFFQNPEILLARSKRGKYEIGPMLITFNDFFGLIQAKFFYKDSKTIHILPHYENIHNLNQKFLQRSFRDHKQVRKIINDENYFDIKEYSPQDDIRRINWKLSAKADTLLVKKPESVNLYIQDSITIFIDNSYVGTTNDVVRDAFDKQVSIAATLSSYYYRQGSKVKLCYLDKANSLRAYSAADFNSFLKFLCLLEFSNITATSGQNMEVIEKGKTIRINQSGQSAFENFADLKEESLIYIYNSLTNSNHYMLFNNEFHNVVKNICVDVKTFITETNIKPKVSKIYRILFTKEYFAPKDSKDKSALSDQWANYIRNKSIFSTQNTVLVTATDSLGNILSK